MFHTIVSIKNDGHYFCRAGGNRPDGLNEPVTLYYWKCNRDNMDVICHFIEKRDV
ncbi:copper resistance protein [Salmonella enterica subsp. enterica serovar Kentucky]|uniref:Copper resistance protein n=1 Tax=Salmonella enterica subsp. enterica serovar Kentucky TaxID=192955 RepID=A0A638X0K9_SALET|nr:copper resistance protein [Salmonella enterica subsp. enterica serovar Kentucky]ECO1090747.1 copper resistance protein [Salmonella enterica subsp. enterica serovar Kentucky]EDG6681353.1 copper resistance protein [Salmonella enterica subsp. enterica serovar Kentucky]EDI3868132.1 copper resistance protein [Salmonella enterica subsp. enterica serovar Kentucky]EDI6915343.1 copper resistance protein [Salmonella enterica subsp. enterica serovar Kentucky]